MTRVELVVRETWKGTPTNRITVVQTGGTLGSRQVIVSGEARYRVGSEVVAFLVESPRGEWLTLELAQGKFDVERVGSDVWVSNPFLGGPAGGGGYRPPNRVPMRIDDLRNRVREALK